MMRAFLFGLAIFFTAHSAWSQTLGLRPPNTKLRQIDTDTVRVIYTDGQESEAQRVVNLVHYMAREYPFVVKDSFTVTEGGEVMTGPLFLMEKRENGFNAGSNDWLYMMVQPTGAVAGITNGQNSAAVRFCADCHNKTPKGQDNLYFLPKELRQRY